ncbi:related to VPS9 (involved in vacuole trafficking) [Pseudozyma flocculosa]|uniref:Related to VPS9 (Involved in vacuole trafficking) n=1 Tax=Pseudozyma flocculosa TaxID=84751 RepID=A0A5C3FB32_9BASI|nr:related to VPS9 (involved in vacuole trafficking) [Pseudozyma flocculosa]
MSSIDGVDKSVDQLHPAAQGSSSPTQTSIEQAQTSHSTESGPVSAQPDDKTRPSEEPAAAMRSLSIADTQESSAAGESLAAEPSPAEHPSETTESTATTTEQAPAASQPAAEPTEAEASAEPKTDDSTGEASGARSERLADSIAAAEQADEAVQPAAADPNESDCDGVGDPQRPGEEIQEAGSGATAKRASIAAAEEADEETEAPAVEEQAGAAPADAAAHVAASSEGGDAPTTTTASAPVEIEDKAAAADPDVSATAVTTSTHDHVDSPAQGDATAPATPTKAATSNSADSVRGRAALADPASVAAVAQAFGRTSSGRSSAENSRPSSRTGVALSQKSLPSFPNETGAAGAGDPSSGTASSSTDAAAGANPTASTMTTATSPVSSDQAEAKGDGTRTEPTGLLSPNPTTPLEGGSGAERRSSGSSASGIKIGKGPPPTTQASEELPFDFNRFLEQMKHRSAGPVGEYVRSFIKGFAKKPYRTADQIKLIFDFLAFISERMKECEVWASLNDVEFENAKEAMEKLVMNRLYPYTFTPAVQKEGRWSVQTDDLERDRILKQRIKLFGWLKEEHLDVPVGDHSRGFIEFSIQELLKINHYKAPRDKLICILNCCKVIFGMIRHLSTEENADTFIPVLIFVVLKANPDNLISNVEYISRFRNPERLSSESGYYLSSLMGAIAFIETMDYTSLSNITQEEFERNVEQAVQAIPEPESPVIRSGPNETPPRMPGSSLFAPGGQHQRTPSATSVTAPNVPGEESAKALPLTPIAASLADDTRAFFQRTGEAARAGFGRPMGALGRLINEGIEGIRTPGGGAESGSSTGHTNSPNPTAGEGSQGMTPSASRSRLFGGLFGPAEPETAHHQQQQQQQQQQHQPPHLRSPLAGAGPGGSVAARRPLALDEEPQTPSTGGLSQDGFLPYNAGQPGAAPNAPPRLRPQLPARGYSIEDHMFDDYDTAGRRNLLAGRGVGGGAGRGDEELDAYDDDDDDDEAGDQDTPNAAAVERMRRRRQMQHDFGGRGGYVPPFLAEAQAQAQAPGQQQQQQNTPTRPFPGGEERTLTRGPLHPSAADPTQQALQQSLLEHQRQQHMQAEEEAQQSAGIATLKSVFPGIDTSVVQLVLEGCEGDVEMAIDRLLEMQ